MNTNHKLYKIRNIDVLFPYDAYPNQLLYMDKVIQSLDDKKNALLESPTGTGKTICLLCSTLAWRENYIKMNTESEKESAPVIVYATRTHSQITQVYKEFTRTAYFDKVKACTIGSRNQYCVNPVVSKKAYEAKNPGLESYMMSKSAHSIGNINMHCHSLVKNRKCGYYSNVKVTKNDYQNPEDIEDLFQLGIIKRECTYFYLKEASRFSDIIFMPYNYIIDPYIRKSLEIEFENSILIIDEAHNIDSFASESCSFDISTDELNSAVRELEELLESFDFNSYVEMEIFETINQDDTDSLLLYASNLIRNISNLSNDINRVHLYNDKFTSDSNFVVEMFRRNHFFHEHSEKILNNTQSIIQKFTLDENTNIIVNKTLHFNYLSRFIEVLERFFAFNLSNPQISSAFKMNIQLEQKPIYYNSSGAQQFQNRERITYRRLFLWCFDPGLAINEIVKSGIRNMILTSGTLSPLSSMESELSLSFPVKLENQHVVDRSQVWVGIVSKAIDGSILTSSYTNRSKDYMVNIGISISELISAIPDGVLVFFPSYSLLENTLDAWRNFNVEDMTLLDYIASKKRIVLEPKDPSKLKSAMNEHYQNIISGNGSIFFAVCRGKVSEGLDFSDRNGRAVIIIGIPYPQYKDDKVVLKKKYLDENISKKHLSGSEWYSQCAWRAVNQSIGRVIRHKNDYGAIIFLDERFNRQKNELSKWLQGYVKYMDDLNKSLLSLKEFYLSMKHLDQDINDNSQEGEVKIDRVKEVKIDWSQIYDKMNRNSPNMNKLTRQSTSITYPLDRSPSNLNNYNTVERNTNLSPETNSFEIHTNKGNTTSRIERTTISPDYRNNVLPIKKDENEGSKIKSESMTNDNIKSTDNDSNASQSNKAKQFLSKAKKELSSSEYKTFQKLMISFKKGEISKSDLCDSILKLLDGKDELIKDFGEFIPRFITKRRSDAQNESSPIKKQKIKEEEDSSTHQTIQIVKTNSSQTVLLPNIPTKLLQTPTKSNNIGEMPEWIKTRHKPTIKSYFPVNQKDNDGNKDKPIILDDNEIKSKNEGKSELNEQKKTSPTKKLINNLITGQKSKRLITSILKTDNEEESISDSPSDEICTICFSKYKDPAKLKCEHIFCYECINNWIKVKLECPICRQRIRVKHIQRLND